MTTPLLSLPPALSNIFRALTAHLSLSLSLHSKLFTNHRCASLARSLSALEALYKSPLCLARLLSLCIYIYIYICIYIYTCVHTLVCAPLALPPSRERKELTTHLTWLSLMCTCTSSPRDSFGALHMHALAGVRSGEPRFCGGSPCCWCVSRSLALSLSLSLSARTYIYIYTYAYIYICIHIYIYVHTCISHI